MRVCGCANRCSFFAPKTEAEQVFGFGSRTNVCSFGFLLEKIVRGLHNIKMRAAAVAEGPMAAIPIQLEFFLRNISFKKFNLVPFEFSF